MYVQSKKALRDMDGHESFRDILRDNIEARRTSILNKAMSFLEIEPEAPKMNDASANTERLSLMSSSQPQSQLLTDQKSTTRRRCGVNTDYKDIESWVAQRLSDACELAGTENKSYRSNKTEGKYINLKIQTMESHSKRTPLGELSANNKSKSNTKVEADLGSSSISKGKPVALTRRLESRFADFETNSYEATQDQSSIVLRADAGRENTKTGINGVKTRVLNSNEYSQPTITKSVHRKRAIVEDDNEDTLNSLIKLDDCDEVYIVPRAGVNGSEVFTFDSGNHLINTEAVEMIARNLKNIFDKSIAPEVAQSSEVRRSNRSDILDHDLLVFEHFDRLHSVQVSARMSLRPSRKPSLKVIHEDLDKMVYNSTYDAAPYNSHASCEKDWILVRYESEEPNERAHGDNYNNPNCKQLAHQLLWNRLGESLLPLLKVKGFGVVFESDGTTKLNSLVRELLELMSMCMSSRDFARWCKLGLGIEPHTMSLSQQDNFFKACDALDQILDTRNSEDHTGRVFERFLASISEVAYLNIRT